MQAYSTKLNKVTNLRCDSEGRWWWTVSSVFEDERPRECFTNKNGEGVFWQDEGGAVRQDVGTCQLDLRGMSVSGARKKLNKLYSSEKGTG